MTSSRKTTLHAAVIASFALLAIPALTVPALAQSGDKEAMPAAARDGACSAEQLAQIDAAFGEAEAAIATTVRRLNDEPNLPELRQWFGATPAKFVRMNLERVAERVARGRPSATACNHPAMCERGENSPFAYALPSAGSMGFCPLFFRAGARGQDSRFGILVHEMSHLAIGTRDATYQPRHVLALAKQEPATAAMNADSYEYLVETLYR